MCALPRSAVQMPADAAVRCHAADWEFVDTFILIVKRKKVSLLQSYHHSGAVIAMWLLATSRSHGAIFFVCVSPSPTRLASTPLTCMRAWLSRWLLAA